MAVYLDKDFAIVRGDSNIRDRDYPSLNLTGARLRHDYGWSAEDLREFDTSFETYGPLTWR